MKTAIILPGWEHDPSETRYTNIIHLFKNAGFAARSYNPRWETHEPDIWVNGLVEELKGTDGQITLLGFSMGAMTALLGSNEINVENLILCSPSDHFKEYTPLLTPDDLDWGRENILGFEQRSAVKVLSQAHVKNGYLLAGSKELNDWADFKQWMSDLQEQTDWKLTIVPDTAHEIEASNYQEAIAALIDRL